MRYRTIVECNRKTWKIKRRLKRFGLKWDGEKFCGEISERQYSFVKQICSRYHLKYYLDNDYGKRGTYYRYTFFDNNSPFIGNYYICAYCGALRSRKKITIDHLIPVSKASKSIKTQRTMQLLGFKSVNDKKNLVAACIKCNKRKGSKTGIWIIRGLLGKYKILWIIRYILRVFIIIIILMILFKGVFVL